MRSPAGTTQTGPDTFRPPLPSPRPHRRPDFSSAQFLHGSVDPSQRNGEPCRMTSRIIVVEPFDLVVFGGTGDLAYRELRPGLYQRHRDGQLPAGGRIIGTSRRPFSEAEYRAAAAEALD